MSVVTVVEPESERAPDPGRPYARRLEALRGRAVPALRRGLSWAVRCPGVWLSFVAAVVFSLFAAFRVFGYVAASLDFGIIYQTVHGWAFHGWPAQPLYGATANEFSDHFAPLLAVLSPLLWIHDSPTTLAVAQAVLVAAAGVPVYVAVRRMHGPVVGTLACAAYLVCTSTVEAIGFDIHENMFTPLLLAWAVERALAGRWTTAAVLIGITVFAYEDMGMVVLVFACWAALNRKWKHAGALAVWGLGMMGLTVGVIMPALGGNAAGWSARHFDYHSLNANSMGQALLHVVEHPRHALHLLLDGKMKRDTWWVLLGPVGFIALFSPITYLGASTVLLLMLSDNSAHWGWNDQFYLQVGPVLYIGAADALLRFRRGGGWVLRRARERYPSLVERFPVLGDGRRVGLFAQELVVVLAALSLATTYAVQQTPERKQSIGLWNWLDDGRIGRTKAEVDTISRVAAHVPAGRNVIVTNDLGVVLLPKDTIVGTPQQADYAFFDTGNQWYPPGWEQQLETQFGFHVVATDGDVVLMQKP
jgi:uncharacterized membrane protein